MNVGNANDGCDDADDANAEDGHDADFSNTT